MKRFSMKHRRAFLWIAVSLLVVVVALAGFARYGGGYPWPYPDSQVSIDLWRTWLIGRTFGYRQTHCYPNGKIRSVEHWKYKAGSDDCWKSDIAETRTFIGAEYFDLEGKRIGYIRNENGLRIRTFDNGRVETIETVVNGNALGLFALFTADGNLYAYSYAVSLDQLGVDARFHKNGRLKETGLFLNGKPYRPPAMLECRRQSRHVATSLRQMWCGSSNADSVVVGEFPLRLGQHSILSQRTWGLQHRERLRARQRGRDTATKQWPSVGAHGEGGPASTGPARVRAANA